MAALLNATRLSSVAVEVSCWEIEAFTPYQHVSVLGLSLPFLEDEENVKRRLNALLGELVLHKDWGGELNDLYSAHCRVRGTTMPAAFMLKGKSVPRPLQIKNCGKHGDQLLRLTDSPANLFVVQHIDVIEQAVRRQVRMNIEALRARDVDAYCCFIDGTQTYQLMQSASSAPTL